MVKKAITFVLIRLAFIWLLNVISHFFWCRVAVLTGCFRCFLNWACVQTSITSAPRKSDACETPSVIALLLFHWNSGTTLWLVTWKKKSSICEYWIPAKILCHIVCTFYLEAILVCYLILVHVVETFMKIQIPLKARKFSVEQTKLTLPHVVFLFL